MKCFVDLDDTLVYSSILNNDAYNYALEVFNYPSINSNTRITRDLLSNISKEKLNKIIGLKQFYFTQNWLKYRVQINTGLVKLLRTLNPKDCYVWTKADINRAKAILVQCNLITHFNSIICEPKTSLSKSICMLKKVTNGESLIVYENDKTLFANSTYPIVDTIKAQPFNISAYYIE